MSATLSSTISARLLHWYDSNARRLAWRSAPGAPPPDPYRVWLSEIMLQQTTVAAVQPYFERFVLRWPTLEALAAAEEADVMAAWAGLGYYSRARNLVKCARLVAAMGGFPQTEDGLRQLPGVGAYTAAAIAAIAFGQRAVVVDANVERVVSRLFAIGQPMPDARRAIRDATDTITPDLRAGDFAQAMMDLGSRICTAREPGCLLCPLASQCLARATGDPAAFPVKPARKVKPQRMGRAFWIERDGAVWLTTRAGTGMLGGMRALPDDSWHAGSDGAGGWPMEGDWALHGSVAHAFSHFSLHLSVWGVSTSADPDLPGAWWPIADLDSAGLPTLFAKAARRALAR